MNIDRTRIKRFGALLPVLACLLLFTAGTAMGADFYLKAVSFTIPAGTFNNPAITMWGYASCTDNTFGTGPGQSCTAPTVPGPALTANAGDTVNIHLQNGLTGLYTEPTSVIIPGQAQAMTPTWNTGAPGNRTSLTQRVRSFTTETPVGSIVTYTWTGVKAGTYLYQSGTHPAVQVQMGLYGALKVLSAAGRAYGDSSSAFDSEVTLLFSEIDPVLHTAIAAGKYGPNPNPPAGWLTSTIDYHPKYFLINGKASPGIPPIAAGAAGGRLLIRFLNAGLQTKVPVVQGPNMSVIAEDGNFMTATDTGGETVAAPKQQYSVFLPAGKTMDAILVPTATGYIPVYDRRLNLSNNGVSPGGMLAYLQVSDGGAARTLTVTKNGTGTGTVTSVSAPGGIDCGSACSQSYLDGTSVVLHAEPALGNAFTPWNTTTASGTSGTCTAVLATGDCLMTMNADRTVNANFRLITKVTVLTPNGGEILPTGSVYTITWEAPAAAVKFNLQYSIDNGTTWITIAKGVPGFSYNWTVPPQAANRPLSRVRVIGLNAAGVALSPSSTYTDISNNPFTIEVIKLTAPNGGEIIPSGSHFNITWTTNATVSPVTSVVLKYSINGGTTQTTIATITGSNPGTYDWTVPAVASTNCKVIVYLKNGSTVIGSDASDAPFTIQMLKLTSPNGGETWTSGSHHNITWTTNATSSPVTSVVLKYSINGGTTQTTITTITGSNPGTYDWIVPAVASTNSKVIVYLKNGSTVIVSDTSDAAFTIAP